MTRTRTPRLFSAFDGFPGRHSVAMRSTCHRRFQNWLGGLSEEARELTIRLIMLMIAAMSGLFVALVFGFAFRAYEVLAGR